jgi:hypothetical protein
MQLLTPRPWEFFGRTNYMRCWNLVACSSCFEVSAARIIMLLLNTSNHFRIEEFGYKSIYRIKVFPRWCPGASTSAERFVADKGNIPQMVQQSRSVSRRRISKLIVSHRQEYGKRYYRWARNLITCSAFSNLPSSWKFVIGSMTIYNCIDTFCSVTKLNLHATWLTTLGRD